MPTEVWQRGPVAGFHPLLIPLAHSLLQVKEDIDGLFASLPDDELLWVQPARAASIGFHIRHIGGSTERLLTYARGESLSAEQIAAARQESTGRPSRDVLVAEVHNALDRALDQIRGTDVDTLLAERKVGRAGLPSTTLGLLFHAAEHATRHAGQAITTFRILSDRAS
jgi:uncharacterized damage-inducible protein DinB